MVQPKTMNPWMILSKPSSQQHCGLQHHNSARNRKRTSHAENDWWIHWQPNDWWTWFCGLVYPLSRVAQWIKFAHI